MTHLTLFLSLGLLLGPSCFQLSLPLFMGTVFSFANFCFLFTSGLEVSFSSLKNIFLRSVLLALGSFLLPFVLGFTFAPFLGELTFSSRLVLGIALSVSALPVIIQILKEQNLFQESLGQLIIGIASLCDLFAWIAFYLILPKEESSHWLLSHASVMGFFLAVLFSSFLTLPTLLLKFFHFLGNRIAAPLFFIGIGYKINIFHSFVLVQFLILFLIAVTGKTLGTYFTARILKFAPTPGKIIAIALNARGAMEILLATLALQAKLIHESTFTALSFMAISTSIMAGPIIKKINFKE